MFYYTPYLIQVFTFLTVKPVAFTDWSQHYKFTPFKTSWKLVYRKRMLTFPNKRIIFLKLLIKGKSLHRNTTIYANIRNNNLREMEIKLLYLIRKVADALHQILI